MEPNGDRSETGADPDPGQAFPLEGATAGFATSASMVDALAPVAWKLEWQVSHGRFV